MKGLAFRDGCVFMGPTRDPSHPVPSDSRAAELLQNRRYKTMLTQDRKTGRLPSELRARLLKGEYGA